MEDCDSLVCGVLALCILELFLLLKVINVVFLYRGKRKIYLISV